MKSTFIPAPDTECNNRCTDIYIGTLLDERYGDYTIAANLPMNGFIFCGPRFVETKEPDDIQIKLTALLDFLEMYRSSLNCDTSLNFWSDSDEMAETWNLHAQLDSPFENERYGKLWQCIRNELYSINATLNVKGRRAN